MRVLIVHYNPGDGGGAESAVRDQRRALEGLGHTVSVAWQHPERAVGAFKPDVVHFHTVYVGIGLQILTWAQARGIPHCLSMHDYWPFCGDRMLMKAGANPGEKDAPCSAVDGLCDGDCAGRPVGPASRAIVNGTPTVIFSEHARGFYERHGIRVDAVVPHGIDTEAFHPADPPVREPVVVTMSAYPSYNTKGLHVLRQAMAVTGIKALLITGVGREAVPTLLRRGSVFVFPSTYQETWGLCLTEAMSTGLACIASNVAGPRAQVVDGETGLLVPPRDAGALASALVRVCADDALRARLGANARAWAVEHASLARMGRDYVAFYERLLGGGP